MLDNFFKPDSVAVIGASREAGKVGYEILSRNGQIDTHGLRNPIRTL